MTLRQHSKLKPSGVEWLGDVPEHWQPISLKWLARRYAGGTPDRSNDAYWDEGTIPWINSGAVNQELIKEPSSFITEEGYRNSSARYVPKGALVMALAGQGKTKGMVAQTAIQTTCNQSMAAIVPKASTNPRYLFWLLGSQYEQIRNMAGGEARDGLNLEILGAIPCFRVPVDEQQSISDFLDRETAKLDTLVEKKRALIDKLKEKRAALISRTVTRGLPPDAARAAGLNPHPKLKQSGVEWIGEVPEHWEVMMLKRTWAVCEYGISESLSGDGPIRVLTMGHIQDGHVLIPEEGCIESVPQSMLLNDGDLLFNRTNSLVHVGKVGLYRAATEDPVTFASYLVRLRTNHLSIPEYMNFLLNTSQVLEFARGLALPSINQANLNPTRYGQITICLPPIEEQRSIAGYLDHETTKIDRLIEKVEAAIERLGEYRTALITAGVTGKIDVRDRVAHTV